MNKPNDDNTQAFTALTKGTMVSHYRIVNKIGAGGMGEVFLAEDIGLDRKVALKFLPSHFAEDENLKQRFIREAKATAKLNHPNIVTIHEVEEYNGRTFFAMEYVDGRSLKTVIKENPLMLDKVVEMAIQIGEGLQQAHSLGIVHRDIKPANIVIENSGRPKILDFGLATITGVEQITKAGSTIGTVGYMSPEQVQGRSSDHRSDLFSFGVVLYEMITGKRPFDKETEAGILNMIINENHEPLSRYKSGIPDELERIIDKLLDKSPELRYQSASGVVSDLKRLDITGQLRPSTEVKIQNERKMVVVLPFENLGPADDEYFADGITEEIISRLAVVKKLGVISRTSAMQYKGSGKSISEIGRELNVDYVLEGTVRWSRGKEFSRVRITPQLIKVTDDTHVWADRYDRTLEDIFDVQSDIAEQVIEQLNVTLLEPEKDLIKAKPTDNMDAYNAYLRGIEFLGMPDYKKENFESAIKMFERAVKLDPGFTQAYAKLSSTHTKMYFFSWDSTTKRAELAKEVLDKAKSLDSSVPEVYLAEASYYYHIKRNYEKAIEAAEIAAKSMPIEPNWVLFAVFRRQGRMQEALKKIKLLLDLTPNDLTTILELGITYASMNEFDKAEKYLLQAESMAPDQENSYGHLMYLYIRKNGDVKKFREVLERMPVMDRDDKIGCHIYEKEYEKALQLLIEEKYPTLSHQYLYYPGKFRAVALQYAMGQDVSDSKDLDEVVEHLHEKIIENPNDHRLYGALAVSYAYKKEKEKAIENGKKTIELMPLEKDWLLGAISNFWMAAVYTLLKEYDLACDELEFLFSNKTIMTTYWIDLDPFFNDLHSFPRYKELMEKYG